MILKILNSLCFVPKKLFPQNYSNKIVPTKLFYQIGLFSQIKIVPTQLFQKIVPIKSFRPNCFLIIAQTCIVHWVFYLQRYRDGIEPRCWVVRGQAFYHWTNPHINIKKLNRYAFFDEKCIPFTNNTSLNHTTHNIITYLMGNY